MPDFFDEQEYKRKLIDGGISPSEAGELARRTAAARRDCGDVPQDRTTDEPEHKKKSRPASQKRPSKPAQQQSFIELVAQHISAAADKNGEKTATGTLNSTIQQAQEAALLKHTKQQMRSLQLSLFNIAPWPDHMRGMPNDFGRSALFTARNKRTPRAELKDEVIFHVMKDVKITYTGTELRTYDDELVWLQVMEYAKRVPFGQPATFTLYEFCKALGWPINGQYYQRIEDSLTRLQTNALKFSSKRVGRLESLSLIRRFGFLDQTDKRKSRCQVLLEEEVVLLFTNEHYAMFVWEKYRKLSGIARRMFDYFSTHREPYPLSLENFRLMCKSDASTIKKWREQAIAAANELQESGLVKAAWVKDDLVRCER